MSESLNDVVSRIVQQHGLSTEKNINKAIKRQQQIRKKSGRKEPLERILVDIGAIKPKHLKGLRYAVLYYLVRKADRFYGKIAVQSNICDHDAVEDALDEQKTLHQKQKRLVRINRLLITGGHVTKPEDKAIQKAIENLRVQRLKGRDEDDDAESLLRFKDSDDDARDVLDNELSDDLELEGVDESDIEELEEVSSADLDEIPSLDDLEEDDDEFDDDFSGENSENAEDLLADLSSEDDLDFDESSASDEDLISEDDLDDDDEDLEDDEDLDFDDGDLESEDLDDYETGLQSDSGDLESYERGLGSDSDLDLDESADIDDEPEPKVEPKAKKTSKKSKLKKRSRRNLQAKAPPKRKRK